MNWLSCPKGVRYKSISDAKVHKLKFSFSDKPNENQTNTNFTTTFNQTIVTSEVNSEVNKSEIILRNDGRVPPIVLPPGVNFTNILRADFSNKSFTHSFLHLHFRVVVFGARILVKMSINDEIFAPKKLHLKK